MSEEKTIKKPSIVWVLVSFAVTIYLLVAYSEAFEEYWYMFMMFIVWDISGLVNYFGKMKAYKQNERIAAEAGERQSSSVALDAPARIVVIRESSIVGAIVPYKIYLNGEFAGDIRNGKVVELETNVSYNVVTATDNSGIPFAGQKAMELSPGGQMEVRLKAGRFKT